MRPSVPERRQIRGAPRQSLRHDLPLRLTRVLLPEATFLSATGGAGLWDVRLFVRPGLPIVTRWPRPDRRARPGARKRERFWPRADGAPPSRAPRRGWVRHETAAAGSFPLADAPVRVTVPAKTERMSGTASRFCTATTNRCRGLRRHFWGGGLATGGCIRIGRTRSDLRPGARRPPPTCVRPSRRETPRLRSPADRPGVACGRA